MNSKARPVQKRDRQGNVLGTFASLPDAVAHLKESGFDKAAASAISNCARGKLKTAYGFAWTYVEKPELEGEIWKPFRDVQVSSMCRVKRRGADGSWQIFENGCSERSNIWVGGQCLMFKVVMAHLFHDMPLDSTGHHIEFADRTLKDACRADNIRVVTETRQLAPTPSDPEITDDYIAGLFDAGGSLFTTINVNSSGAKALLLRAEFTSSNRAMLEMLQRRLGDGRIYEDSRVARYKADPNMGLKFAGRHASTLLDIVKRRGIVKAPQAETALQIIGAARGAKDEKTALRERIRELNEAQDSASFADRADRLSLPYVAGYFDGRGEAVDRTHDFARITHKSRPGLMKTLRDFVGLGHEQDGRWSIRGRDDMRAFRDSVGVHCIVRREAIEAIVASFPN